MSAGVLPQRRNQTLSKRIRICYFTASLEVGGSERQLVALNAGLPNAQYEKHIICLSGYGPLEADARSTGATLHDLAYPRIKTAGTIGWRNIPTALATLGRLVRLLRRLRPDILHTMLPVCNVLGLVGGKLARVPHIVCTKLALGVYRESSRILPILEDMTDPRFDLVHCKSQGIVKDISAREPIRPEKMRVIYNGLHAEKYENVDGSAVREEFHIPPEAFVIGMVANLIPYKGHADMLEAAAKVLERFPQVRFLFVGRDNGILASLLEQARAAGIEHALSFTGERRDIPQQLAAMNMLVSASHQEGFSNVLLEAMASGLPIVATTVGGNPEAVEEGVTGYLVEPHAPAQLAEVILRVVEDPQRAKEMGAKGRERVKRLFSYEVMISGMEEFYGEVLK